MSYWLQEQLSEAQEQEIELYRQRHYTGIPSCLLFLGSSEPWKPVHRVPTKCLMPLDSRSLAARWKSDVIPMFISYLDAQKHQWTSLDPVALGTAISKDEEHYLDLLEANYPPTNMIWVGILPGTMPFEEGNDAARSLKRILGQYQIEDVIVEIRESDVFDLTSTLLRPKCVAHCMNIRNALSTTVGIPIVEVSKDSKVINGGTAGLILTGELEVAGETQRCKALLTCRHVIAQYHSLDNTYLCYPIIGSSSKYVAILSTEKYRELEDVLNQTILADNAALNKNRIGVDAWGDDDVKVARYQKKIDELELIIPELDEMNEKLMSWNTLSERVIGEVMLSPPIGHNVGLDDEPQDGIPTSRIPVNSPTEDWALVRLDDDAVGHDNFDGNKIFVGDYFRPDFNLNMGITLPPDGFLRYTGTIPKAILEDLATIEVKNGKPVGGLPVMHDGTTSGVRFGKLSGLQSVVRHIFWYFDSTMGGGIQTARDSLELAVYGMEAYEPFSAPGDSGSTVVDGHGNVIGMLTSGCGNESREVQKTRKVDVTYVTDIHFLESRMKKFGFQPNLFPDGSNIS